MSFSGSHLRGKERHLRNQARSGSLVLCIAVLLLSACTGGETETEEDRRFANDPTPASRPTQVLVPTPTQRLASPVAELPPADTLLRARGAASTAYVILRGKILVLRPDTPGAAPLEIAPPPGQEFAKVTSSPNGDRVAAMLIPRDAATARGASGTLVVYDPRGATLKTWRNVVGPGAPAATPVATDHPRDGQADIRLEWSSQGDQILVTANRNALVTVPLEGNPIPIRVPTGISLIEDAQWSPRGDQIALLAKGGDGPTGVQLFTPGAEPPNLEQVIPPNEGTIPFPTIEQFAWLPDGSGIAYILADGRTGAPADGQVFALDFATGAHRLIATPGQGGPAASIANFSLSPDGKAIAYVIATPDRERWTFHSLWVRSLRDARTLRLPVTDVLEVNAVWWTARGLLWGQAVQTEGAGVTETFVLQAPDSEPIELASFEVLPPAAAATPSASPVASPVSTPGG